VQLTGVDARQQLRRYRTPELWILVPLALVLLLARDTLRVCHCFDSDGAAALGGGAADV